MTQDRKKNRLELIEGLGMICESLKVNPVHTGVPCEGYS